MNHIFLFMVPLVIGKTLLMTSLLPKKRYIYLFSAICLLFVLLVHPFALEQNKLALEQLLSSHKVLTNLSIIVMIDLLLSVGFSREQLLKWSGVKQKRAVRWQGYLPSILIFPVLYYLHLTLFFQMPGHSFSLLTASFAIITCLSVAGGSSLLRRYLPEVEIRTELTLIISLLLFLLTICFTVFHPSSMIYIHRQPVNWNELLLTFIIILSLAITGFVLHRIVKTIKINRKINQ